MAAIIEPFAPDDAQTLAAALIDRFGSLGAVLAAGRPARHALLHCHGRVEDRLALLSDAILHGLHTETEDRPLLAAPKPIIEYLRWLTAYERAERFYALLLDVKGHLISAELLALGTIDRSVVYPREVVRLALELGAATVILAHNHPSGDSTPSQQDVDLTNRVSALCEGLGIAVYDHIIIARGEWLSLRAEGLIA